MILTDRRHLVSDLSLQELHSFAASIGLHPNWFQDHRFPHYDLFFTKHFLALWAGARIVTTRELVRRAIRKEPAP